MLSRTLRCCTTLALMATVVSSPAASAIVAMYFLIGVSFRVWRRVVVVVFGVSLAQEVPQVCHGRPSSGRSALPSMSQKGGFTSFGPYRSPQAEGRASRPLFGRARSPQAYQSPGSATRTPAWAV